MWKELKDVSTNKVYGYIYVNGDVSMTLTQNKHLSNTIWKVSCNKLLKKSELNVTTSDEAKKEAIEWMHKGFLEQVSVS